MVHIHRLKPCFLNLGRVQNKILTTVLNIQGLMNGLQGIGIFSGISFSFYVMHENSFRSYMTMVSF